MLNVVYLKSEKCKIKSLKHPSWSVLFMMTETRTLLLMRPLISFSSNHWLSSRNSTACSTFLTEQRRFLLALEINFLKVSLTVLKDIFLTSSQSTHWYNCVYFPPCSLSWITILGRCRKPSVLSTLLAFKTRHRKKKGTERRQKAQDSNILREQKREI